jgi:transposase-like protein
MGKQRQRIALDVRAQILRRVKDEGISVSQAANEHGVSIASIYQWMAKDAAPNATVGEVVRLRRENQALLKLVGELTMKLSLAQKKS